jgi:hypothetical protein
MLTALARNLMQFGQVGQNRLDLADQTNSNEITMADMAVATAKVRSS